MSHPISLDDHFAENATGLRPAKVRQGETSGRVRYMLAISLGLVIAAFAIIYFVNF